MRAHRAAVVLALFGCSSDPAAPGASARVTLVNALGAGGAVQWSMDGHFIGSVAAATQGGADGEPGQHVVQLSREDGTGAVSRSVVLSDRAALAVIAYDSSGVLWPVVLDDSNAVVPSGASKLRVAHFAAAAGAIDVWRTQPDYATPIRVMFPFAYRDVSPYLQSAPGAWRVLVSSAISNSGPMPDTLAMTGAISVPTGEARTVVVVDRPAGGVAAIALEP